MKDRDRDAIEATKRVGLTPTAEFRRATVIGGGPAPTVLIDGASSAVPATPTTAIPSNGQRVLVTYALGGAVLITDILGGVWSNLGSTNYSTAQTGITTEVALDGLSLDIDVPYPNHLIRIRAKVWVITTAGAPEPVLRVREDDVSGTVIGRIDEAPPLAVGDVAVLQGEIQWVTPDDDEYALVVTLANGGAGTLDTASNATSPTRVAEFDVTDYGWYVPSAGP